MEAFLSQNLVWIILAVGAIFVFSRMHGGGLGGIFGGGHHGGGGGIFGGGHGGHRSGPDGGDHSGGGRGDDRQAPAGVPAAIDPVSRNPVDPGHALTSFYAGRVYYFESAETRAKFEAAPGAYASAMPPQPEREQSRRQHGC